jgi:ribosome-associated toxin RatA of RatAB toxin-antitoxin module
VPVISGSSSAEVDAPIERCWEVVEDVASAPEWQGGLVELEVIERDDQGRPLICDAVSDIKLRKVRTCQRFTYESPNRLGWEMVEGDLASMEGYWELEDLDDGRTSVTYGLAVDPGPIGRLARVPLERAARVIAVNPRPNELARRVARLRAD